MSAWPELKRGDNGHLLWAGADTVELARRFGTPLYVYDEERIRQACRHFLRAVSPPAPEMPPGQIFYAGKAFLTLALVRLIREEGLGLDVVSGGELYTALAAGFPPEKIAFHGNNKQPREVEEAVRAGVGLFVADNFRELDLLEEVLSRQGRSQDLLLRVAPGVEAHTHEYVLTGQQDSKFGFDLASGQLVEAARRVAKSPVLRFRGLHCHIGSQILDRQPYLEAARVMVGAMARVKEEAGLETKILDMGGGFGIHYLPEDHPPDPAQVIRAVAEEVARGCRERGMDIPALAFEPGRSVVGEAALALYTVGAVKRVPGLRTYVSVDGGMGDNPRPALYGASYWACPAARPSAPPEEEVRIVGRFCESGDVLIPRIEMPRLEPGEVVAVFSAGAYQYSMASNYNRCPRPAVVLIGEGGKPEVIVARESYHDLLSHDRVPPRLR